MSTNETVADLAMRYVTEFLVAGPQGFPEFTIEEVDRLREFVNERFTEDERVVLHVYASVVREFASGHRCGVCGRTSAQSKAINYDCAREC